MDLENQKVIGVNRIYISDAQNSPLTSFKLKRNENTSDGTGDKVIVHVSKEESIVNSDSLSYVFELENALRYYNGTSDEFVLETKISNGNVTMEAKVIRRIGIAGYLEYEVLEQEVIEIVENYPMPIMLFEGINYITTNYNNADLEVMYSKDDILNKFFVSNASFYAHKLTNAGDFSLDDIYFKDAFTRTEDKLNIEVDRANVSCIMSKNNKFSLDEEGNLIVKSITTESSNHTNNTSIINLVYPVGSIYLSVNNVNPTTLFGGTWEQIKDKFLLSCGDVYAVGSTGGEASHTLSVNEMPGHSHSWSQSSCTNPGNHTHVVGADKDGGGGTNRYTVHITANNTANGAQYSPVSGSAGGHTHTIGGTNTNTGGGQAHNNMPPYLAISIWKRVA